MAGAAGPTAAQQIEDAALESLGVRCGATGDNDAAKLQRLISELSDIGIGPKSAIRAVVFSERIATLDWLARTVPQALGLHNDQVRVLHGGIADSKQIDVIRDFGLAENAVRLLLTGDMASEGVNLHRECHHLIHFDLPWSLITIEQRNGRIDRYGQRHSPDIRALLLTPEQGELTGDVRILTRLLEREDHAHRAFGESGSLLGLHVADLEEEAIMRALRDGIDADDIVPEKPKNAFDLMAILSGGTGLAEVPTIEPPSLFASTSDFVEAALRLAYDDPDKSLDIRREDSDPTLVSLAPPADLLRRLRVLPQEYLTEQKLVERLRLTADETIANQELTRARESTSSDWPEVGHLSPLHPFVEWLTDKVLVSVGRNQAPILLAAVDAPVFCVQGMYSNGRGQPQLVEWLAVMPGSHPPVTDLFSTLERTGVLHGMANPGVSIDAEVFRNELATVVDLARVELDRCRLERDREVIDRLQTHRDRRQRWTQGRLALESTLDNAARQARLRAERTDVEVETDWLIESMQTTGQPLIRVLAVLVGAGK